MSPDPQQEETVFIGEYIVQRLVQLNVRSMFGVPGDFNLGFLDFVEDNKDIEWIGNCNELNSAYAADGYVRVAQSFNSQSLGVVTTTFGVGELSAINGIAGAFSEHIPVLHIVGVPSTSQLKSKPLLHHTLGDGRFDAYTKAAEQVTASSAILKDSQNAAAEIDRVITECIIWSRPAYLTLPTDLAYTKIPSAPLKAPLKFEIPPNDPEAEKYVLNIIVDQVQEAADAVAVLVDACALRHHSIQEVRDFAAQTKFPVYSAPMGKSIIHENDERFGGIYVGQVTRPDVLKLVESSRLFISIGAILSDFNTGGFTYNHPTTATIELHSDHVKVGFATFHGVGMKHLLPKLTERLKNIGDRGLAPVAKWSTPVPSEDNAIISHNWLWPKIGTFLKENDIIVAETGTAAFGTLGIPFPPHCVFVSQILWGSIGWTVGATLGAALAAREKNLKGRVCLFVGDGSLQLTVQELSTMIKTGLTPIIFIINNKGYTIERFLHGETKKYNDVQDWKWTQLLSVFGGIEGQTCRSYKVETKNELSDLLANESFAKADVIQVVELIMDKLDAPIELRKSASLSKSANKYALE